MARAHTQLTALDAFAGSPALNEKLTTSASWSNVWLATSGTEYFGVDLDSDGTSDAIEYRDTAVNGTRQIAKHAAAPASADYTVWCEYGGHASSTRLLRIGPLARITDSETNWDGYGLLYVYESGSQASLDIWKIIDGIGTRVAAYPVTLSPGDAIALEINGTGATVTLKGYINDAQVILATDSAANRLTSTGSPGIYGNVGTTGTGDPLARIREWRLYETASGRAAMNGPLGGRRVISLATAR